MSWGMDLPFSQTDYTIFFALTHGAGELAPRRVQRTLKGCVEMVSKVVEDAVNCGSQTSGGAGCAFGHNSII
jgi:hypothetical protein